MPDTQGVERRLEHLERASDFLTISSPRVASFLRATSREVAEDNRYSRPQSTMHFCPACSARMIPAWSAEIISADPQHGVGNHKEMAAARNKTISRSCSMCSTEVTMVAKKPGSEHHPSGSAIRPPVDRSKRGVKRDTMPPTTTTPGIAKFDSAKVELGSDSVATKTDNAGNKGPGNRKRPRKNASSLQAMLAKSKADNLSSKGHALSLSDLLES